MNSIILEIYCIASSSNNELAIHYVFWLAITFPVAVVVNCTCLCYV